MPAVGVRALAPVANKRAEQVPHTPARPRKAAVHKLERTPAREHRVKPVHPVARALPVKAALRATRAKRAQHRSPNLQ